jgi:hypothetical protein
VTDYNEEYKVLVEKSMEKEWERIGDISKEVFKNIEIDLSGEEKDELYEQCFNHYQQDDDNFQKDF